MKIKKLEGLHLTATNKKHIVQLLERGWKEGGTKTIWYEVLERDGNVVKLTVSKKDKNDYGRVFWRNGTYVIQVSE
jgi:hypothetical protein